MLKTRSCGKKRGNLGNAVKRDWEVWNGCLQPQRESGQCSEETLGGLGGLGPAAPTDHSQIQLRDCTDAVELRRSSLYFLLFLKKQITTIASVIINRTIVINKQQLGDIINMGRPMLNV